MSVDVLFTPALAYSPQGVGSVSEANKSIFRRFVEWLVGRGDLGAVDELLTEDFVENTALLPDLPAGREAAVCLAARGFPRPRGSS